MTNTKTAWSRAGTTKRSTVARILRAWEASTAAQREAGAQWYGEAQQAAQTMAQASGQTLETAAAVIAHLSPRTPWGRNVAGASAVLSDPLTRPVGIIPANFVRAQQAMLTSDPLETVRGPKTRSFAQNILGDSDAVTVDVWAVRIALGDRETEPEKILARAGVYDVLADAYRAAARQVGVTPATMQATTWLVAGGGRRG